MEDIKQYKNTRNPVRKWYLKTWAIQNYYQYDIYQVFAGDDMWYMAEPRTRGIVTRTAENEKILKIILENDCINATKFQQRVR